MQWCSGQTQTPETKQTNKGEQQDVLAPQESLEPTFESTPRMLLGSWCWDMEKQTGEMRLFVETLPIETKLLDATDPPDGELQEPRDKTCQRLRR